MGTNLDRCLQAPDGSAGSAHDIADRPRASARAVLIVRLQGVSRAPAASPRAQELPRKRRRLVLAICCMSLLIVGLDNTIVNVALPSIGRELHASVSELQWTVDSYTWCWPAC